MRRRRSRRYQPTRFKRRRRGFTLGSLWFAVMVACALWPGSASAHARLQAATPEPGSALVAMPTEIVLTFSEPVSLAYSSASLLTESGDAIPLGQVTSSADQLTLHIPIVASSPPPVGAFTLAWRVLSAVDGHVTTGTVAFSAGTGEAPATSTSDGRARPPWWRVFDRWLIFAALTVLAGRGFFYLLMGGDSLDGARGERWLGWAAWSALAGGLALSAYDLGILVVGRSFINPPAPSTYGAILTGNVIGRGLLVVAALSIVQVLVSRVRPARGPLGLAVHLAIWLSALGALSATGHAAALTPRWREVAIDWLHLSAVACWLGTLPWLWLTIHATVATADSTRTAKLAKVLGRFSNAALVLMLTILLTGFLRGFAQVAGPRALRSSDYGIVLIAKHLLLLPVLISAGVSKLVIVPRLRQAMATHVLAIARLLLGAARVLIGVELAAACAILLAAAALTQLTPADAPLAVDVASRPTTINQRVEAGDLSVWLQATLGSGETDRYTLKVRDAGGGAPVNLQRLIVQTSKMINGTPVGDRFDAQPLGDTPGAYFFPAARIALHGQWSVSIIVRRAGVEDVTAAFTIDTTNLGTQPPRIREDSWRLPRATVSAWLFGVFSLALLVGGVIAVKRLRALDPFAAAIMLTMLMLMVAGFAVQGARKAIPTTAGSALANPIAADLGSVQRAEGLYTELCLNCHGAGGAGIDNTEPEHSHGSGTNLIDGRTQDQHDGDLYWSLTNGIAGTDMPAFDQALSDQERWDLVNYLRSLAIAAAQATPTPS